MVQLLIFSFLIAVFVIWILLFANKELNRESAIAIVEFGEKVDKETANWFLEKYPIDWYIFDETAIQEEELEDLKQHYKIILEVK